MQKNKKLYVAYGSNLNLRQMALDGYEGVSSGHYYKQVIPVKMGDRAVSAMVYIMNPKMTYGIPTQRYYNAVLEGYENCELDPRMLNEAVDKSIAAYRELEQQRRVFQASRFYDDIGDVCDETLYMDEQMHF